MFSLLISILLSLFYKTSILVNSSDISDNVSERDKWLNVEMPERSLFAGFEAPNDKRRWKQAINYAVSGSQLLLEKVQQQISSYEEVLKGI